MQWIETILDIDRRTSKDPRIDCGYCDMNNHPRFTCKHFYKHQDGSAQQRCTLCKESRQPDLRWGQDLAQPPTESPSQDPAADQQPMCAAIAMMRGIPSGAASSWQGSACPPIREHRPRTPPAMQEEAILPNPGYKVAANLWNPRYHGASSYSRANGIILATCHNDAESRISKLCLRSSTSELHSRTSQRCIS